MNEYITGLPTYPENPLNNISPERRKDVPITVLYGGISSERPGSIDSSKTVADLLLQAGYKQVERMDIVPQTIYELEKIRGNSIAFMTMHGGFGEDGTLQGLLEMMDIPYTGCGVAASAISADKHLFSNFVRSLGYKVPNQIVISDENELGNLDIDYPKVIKPVSQGCSYGIFFVRNREELLNRAPFTMKFADRMVIEDYIEGREITVGMYEDPHSDGPQVLPLAENILAREILDYEAKYPGGEHLYKVVIPAQIDQSAKEEIEATCTDIFRQLDCRGYVRMDLRLTKDGGIYLLENNTSPGMLSLEESDFPKMLVAGDINPANFVDLMVEASLVNFQQRRRKFQNLPSEREMVDYLGLKFAG